MRRYWLTDLRSGEGLLVDAEILERLLGVEISYIDWALETDGMFGIGKWRVENQESTLKRG